MFWSRGSRLCNPTMILTDIKLITNWLCSTPWPTPMVSLDSKQSMYVAPLRPQAERNLNRLIFTGCSTNTKWLSVIPKLQTDKQRDRRDTWGAVTTSKSFIKQIPLKSLYCGFTVRNGRTNRTCVRRRVLTSRCWVAEPRPGISQTDLTCLETHRDGVRDTSIQKCIPVANKNLFKEFGFNRID